MDKILSPLELELAAYSPWELTKLSDTVDILLNAADDGTARYAATRVGIEAALQRAVAGRLEAERRACHPATIVPFQVRE